jgi:hypothetical protein
MIRKIIGLLCAGCCSLAFAGPVLAQAPAVKAAPAKPTAPASWPKGPGSLTGVWLLSDYKTSKTFDILESAMKENNGQLPPMLPAVAAEYQRRLAASRAGAPFATPRTSCQPGGMPQSMFGPMLLVEFLETKGEVTVLFEEFTNFRQIFLNVEHSADPDPTFFGESVGHWEGDTLVVDTKGLNAHTVLDTVGMPHSEDMHLVERIRRVDQKTLEDVVAFDDPKTFSRPWTAKTTHFTLQPAGTHLREDICEDNRNAPTAEGTVGLQHNTPAPAH